MQFSNQDRRIEGESQAFAAGGGNGKRVEDEIRERLAHIPPPRGTCWISCPNRRGKTVATLHLTKRAIPSPPRVASNSESIHELMFNSRQSSKDTHRGWGAEQRLQLRTMNPPQPEH